MFSRMEINGKEIIFEDCKSCKNGCIDPDCKRECIKTGKCCYEPTEQNTRESEVDCAWR